MIFHPDIHQDQFVKLPAALLYYRTGKMLGFDQFMKLLSQQIDLFLKV